LELEIKIIETKPTRKFGVELHGSIAIADCTNIQSIHEQSDNYPRCYYETNNLKTDY